MSLYYVMFQVDEFSVSEGMALHLAGIQAQVIHGDYVESKCKRYAMTSLHKTNNTISY